MRAELTRAQADVERMSAELETKNAKLAESEQLLNSNNQVRPLRHTPSQPTDAWVCSAVVSCSRGFDLAVVVGCVR